MPDEGDELVQLDAWLREVCAALNLPMSLIGHRLLLLDVARDAARGVMRPAAPLTTFLIGYAAGRKDQEGQGDAALVDAAAITTALASSWIPEPDQG
jgi:Domain of unknown function (DUF6457)